MDTLKACRDRKQEREDKIRPIELKFNLLEESSITLKEEDL